MKVKLKLFLQRHYKKIVVPFICIFLSFSLVLVASAEIYNYNLWEFFSYGNYVADFEVGYKNLSARISNHNPNVPNAILAYNVPDIEAENGLTQFYLNVYLDSSVTPYIYTGDYFRLSGDFISNFSFIGENGQPCTLTLSKVELHTTQIGIISTTSGTNLPIVGDGIVKYNWFANFDIAQANYGDLRLIRILFKLDRPAVSTSWGTHELQYSCSFNNNINFEIKRNKAEAPIYTPPDQGTLDSALDVEGELIDEVGGDLDRLDGLLDSSNINDDTIYKPISAFTAIFQDLFEQNNAVGSWLERLLNFSVAVGLSGFVLNIVVGIVSHFSAHSRDGSNNPKGGGS